MRIYLTSMAIATAIAACAAPGHIKSGWAKDGSLPEPTVLESREMPGGHVVQVVRDINGHIYKQTLRPAHEASGISHRPDVKAAPAKAAGKTERTYYEGFEGYDESAGLNWLPEGWTRINTEAHAPTAEGVAHNVNNGWYAYYSSNLYQQMTTDGQCEAFIHFGYDGNYGASSAAQDEWLVSPEITLTSDETLTFMLQCDYSTVYEWDWSKMKFKDRSVVENTMKVMVTTDGGANWECIWDLEADVVRSISDRDCYDAGELIYYDFSVPMTEYAGKKVKIAFRYERASGWCGNSMTLDRVVVEHPAGPWSLMGTGTMADGWVVPNLTKNPNELYNPQDYIFDVEVYESNVTPGLYKISSPYTSAKFPFLHLNANKDKAYDIIIDASNPEFVVVEPQVSGFEHNDPGSKAARYAVPYYISHSGKRYFDEGNSVADIIKAGYASTFDAEKGIITICGPEYGHVKADGTLDMGYMCSNDESHKTVITLPMAPPEPKWESAGTAHFVDAFIYPGYFDDPTGHGWDVEVQTKSDKPGCYRLVNLYTADGCPLKDYNTNTTDAYVLIDASDPQLVVIEPQYSGFSSPIEDQNWDFYIGNLVGYYLGLGYDLKTLADVLKADEKDTLEDLVITIKKPLFGSNNLTEFGYEWQDKDGVRLPYFAKIYLPGTTQKPDGPSDIETITINASDSPAQYYTPMGVRLPAEPAHGIYIMVKDGKAVKIAR